MARGGADQEIHEIRQRLALIEAHLEQIFTHIQVQPRKRTLGGCGDRAGSGDGWWGGSEDAAEAGPREAVIELVRAGNKIEAIKVHRDETGLGLAEAKKAIDNL